VSVFISYSHKDSVFVDKLSLALIERNVKVWKDKWRVSVGESFINKIQDGIEGAKFLCVVLSNNSVNSEWVKKEINAALIREIEEREIIILPVLIDDCKVPLLLREKRYADFRDKFSEGLKALLGAVEKQYNIGISSRTSSKSDYYFDFTIENGWDQGKFIMNIDIVSFDKEENFSILSKFFFQGNILNSVTTKDEGSRIRTRLLKTCAQEFINTPGRIKITGDQTTTGNFEITDPLAGVTYQVVYSAKRLGENSGNTILFNMGALFFQMCDQMKIEY
jgi:hypothetical protein